MKKSLLRAQGGNIAVLFSLLTFPLLAGVGLALEYSNISAHRSKLQNAVDSATLFAGKFLIENDSLPTPADIEGFVQSNYDGPFSLSGIDQSPDELSITVDATVPDFFLAVFTLMLSIRKYRLRFPMVANHIWRLPWCWTARVP